MQGYWRFEGNISDSSVNGYNLTPVGSPAFVTGLFGSGRDYEESGTTADIIADASCPNLEITGAKSYLGWFKFESHAAGSYLMAKVRADGTVGVGLRYNTTSGLGFIHSGTTTNNEVNSTVHPTDGIWTHIAGVYTGAKLQIYVNGSLTEVNAAGSSTDTNGDFAIGRYNSASGLYFDGIADDCAVYNDALTAEEVLSLYNDTAPGGIIFFD
jgi:hypothetical protein